MANIDRNCSALLRKVYEASFAVDDVILYLDTHPDDQDANPKLATFIMSQYGGP